MGFAFPRDSEGVVAGEVDEPFAGDELGVMGFGNLEPAAVDPSADGLVLVAEDGFHVLWGYDVGQVVPLIVKQVTIPKSCTFGRRLLFYS